MRTLEGQEGEESGMKGVAFYDDHNGEIDYISNSSNNENENQLFSENYYQIFQSNSSSSLNGLSQLNYNDYYFTFLKIFKKYLPKLQKYEKIHKFTQKYSSKSNEGKSYQVNDEVYVTSIPSLRNNIGKILKIRKRNYYYVQFGGKKYVLPGRLLHSSSQTQNNETTTTTNMPSNTSISSSFPEFQVGDLVFVETRCWIGMNKEGGVGRITRRHEPKKFELNQQSDFEEEETDQQPTYDVMYVLGGKEQYIPSKFISLKRFEDVTNKPRSTLGRCSIPGCFSFVCDCKHDQQQKHIESVIQNIQRFQHGSKSREMNETLQINQVPRIPRKKTPQNIRDVRVHGTKYCSSLNSSAGKNKIKKVTIDDQDSGSEFSGSDSDGSFIQAEGTLIPPNIKYYAEKKVASLSEEDQLAYLNEISGKLKNCLKKINKYAARGEDLFKQLPQIVSNSEGQRIWVKSIRKLRKKYQKYLVKIQRKYIDVGNMIARKFENRISSTLRKQFILAETEFTNISQEVESRGIEVRKRIESIECEYDTLLEVSFADKESSEDSDYFEQIENNLSISFENNSSSDEHIIAPKENFRVGSKKIQRKRKVDRTESGETRTASRKIKRKSEDEFIASEDDLQIQSKKLKRKSQSNDQSVDTKTHQEPLDLNIIAYPEVSEITSLFSTIQHDKFFIINSEFSSTEQERNRIIALSTLDSLLDIHQTTSDQPSFEKLLSIISIIFQDLASIASSNSTRSQEFLPKLFIIEIIWQQYAVRNELICKKILEDCDSFEQFLLSKFPLTSDATSTSSTTTSIHNTINIFFWLRRKILWIRLLIHVHALQNNIEEVLIESKFIHMVHKAEEKVWFILFYLLIHHGNIFLTIFKKPYSSILDLNPFFYDFLCLLTTLSSKYFYDFPQLATTAYISLEEASTSEIKISIWSIFNFYFLQLIPIIKSSSSLHSFLISYLNDPTDTSTSTGNGMFRIPSYLGHFDFFLNLQQDSLLWTSLCLFTWIQVKNKHGTGTSTSISFENIPYASLISNWQLLKELTKDMTTSFSLIIKWLGRINYLLPLWDNSSNGFDLYRELLGRLFKLDMPWCSSLELLSMRNTTTSSLRAQVLLLADSYQSHIMDKSESPLLYSSNSDIFAPSGLLELFSHYSSSIGIVPPRYDVGMETPELGEYLLPHALSLFSHGLKGLTVDSISYKRIQNKLSTLPLLCKDTSSLAAPVCLISLLKCSVNVFGPTFYTESLHQTVITIISNQNIYTIEERQYLSWYISLILFLPSQSLSLVSSTLGRYGFSYFFSILQLVLEDILSGGNHSSSIHIIALASLFPIIDGIHLSNYHTAIDDDSNEKRIRMIFSLWNGTLRMSSGGLMHEDGMELLVLTLCGLNRFFANFIHFLYSHSLDEIRGLLECIFSMLKDLLPVLRDILVGFITNCVRHGSKYRDNFHWQYGLLLSRILGRVYWIIGYIKEIKFTLQSVLDLFRLPTPLSFDEYPIDIWFKTCFWSEISLLCQQFHEFDYGKLFSITTDHVFYYWIGTLATSISDPRILQDLNFFSLHQFLLSENFLNKSSYSNNFIIFIHVLSRLKYLNLLFLKDLTLNCTSHSHTREDLLSLLQSTYQILYSFMLSCTVETYTHPVSERSNYKDIFRLLLEIFERVKSFITHRNSRSSNLEYLYQYASHLLNGWIGGSLLIPLSHIENLGKLCEIPLAFANNLEDFLIEHGLGTTIRDEPNPSHLLTLLTLPHLICGISFFSFSTRIFQCWKPLLRLLCVAQLHSTLSIRSFLIRCWSISLLDRKIVSNSFLMDVIPSHWLNEFRRCNYILFSQRIYDYLSLEFDNISSFTNKNIHYSSTVYQSSPSIPSSYSPYSSSSMNSTIGEKYRNYSNFCVEKLRVFREYVLNDDALWMDSIIFLNSKTMIITTRIDLILDVFFLSCQFITDNPAINPPTSSITMTPNDNSLLIFPMIPNCLLSIILSSLRILAIYHGHYSIKDILGTFYENEISCFISCLKNFYHGASGINQVFRIFSIKFSSFILSWKSFLQSFLCLLFSSNVLEFHDFLNYCNAIHLIRTQLIRYDSSSPMVHSPPPHPAASSSTSYPAAQNISNCLSDECNRLIDLIHEKLLNQTEILSIICLMNLDDSSLQANSDLLGKCQKLLEQDY